MKFPMETSVPNRVLREGILSSEAVNRLSEQAELFYRRLMSVVDDYGRMEANLELLRARCFPLQIDRWPLSRVGQVLAECGEVLTTDGSPLVTVYEGNDANKKYLQINNFQQRMRSPSKCPGPSVRVLVDELRSHDGHMRASRARTPPPSPPTVVSYEVKEGGNGNGISAEPAAPTETAQMSQRFSEWWEVWSAVRGTAKRIQAVQAWLSIATVDLEAAIFECTASYLSFGVGRDGRGFNPDTFLFEQAKDNFHARWVPPKSKAQTRQEEWESA